MEDLVFYYPEGHEAHFERGHPERPERVEGIRMALSDSGLWDIYPKYLPIDVPDDIIQSILSTTGQTQHALQTLSSQHRRTTALHAASIQSYDGLPPHRLHANQPPHQSKNANTSPKATGHSNNRYRTRLILWFG